MNKDLEIANLTSKTSELNIEATVERGLGYVPREVLEKEKVDVGTLTIDAIFTPIRKVNYEVENMRVGDRTDYNRLRISIQTDGTIAPRKAIEDSVNIIIKQLQSLIFIEPSLALEERGGVALEAQPAMQSSVGSDESSSEDPLKVHIEDLELSARTQNALSGASIRTVGGLVKKTREDLLNMPGVGSKAVEEIEEALSRLGLSLKV